MLLAQYVFWNTCFIVAESIIHGLDRWLEHVRSSCCDDTACSRLQLALVFSSSHHEQRSSKWLLQRDRWQNLELYPSWTPWASNGLLRTPVLYAMGSRQKEHHQGHASFNNWVASDSTSRGWTRLHGFNFRDASLLYWSWRFRLMQVNGKQAVLHVIVAFMYLLLWDQRIAFTMYNQRTSRTYFVVYCKYLHIIQ